MYNIWEIHILYIIDVAAWCSYFTTCQERDCKRICLKEIWAWNPSLEDNVTLWLTWHPIRRFPLREPSSGDTHGHPCSLHPKRAEQNVLHINLPFMSHFLFSYSHCTSNSLRMQGGNDRFHSHWSLVSIFEKGMNTHHDVPEIYIRLQSYLMFEFFTFGWQ